MFYRALMSMWVVGLAACAANNDNGNDATLGVKSITGAGNGFTPAPRSALLQVSKSAGAVLAHPVLHLVTFNQDADATALADFAQKLTVSNYWSATTHEYGVGTLTAAAPQNLTFAWGSSATDGDLNSGAASTIEAYLVSQLDGSAPAWGAPDVNAIYALMLPSGVTVSPDAGSIASACNANILSWHTAMLLPSSQVVVTYAVVPNCGARGGLSELDTRTVALSHAVVSAATDPLLNAFNTLDANHLAWQLATGSPEVGAACAAGLGAAELVVRPSDLPYAVQRTWSNAAALGGDMPCVPATAQDVYFSAVPVLTNSVQVAMSPNPSVPTQPGAGVSVAVGSTQQITLQLSSTGATSGPWNVSAQELGSSLLQLSVDKASGNNGDSITLTVRANSAGTGSSQALVQITSALGTQVSHEYFVVRTGP